MSLRLSVLPLGLALALASCGPKTPNYNELAVGTWRVDLEHSTMPLSGKDKAEEQTFRLDVKSDHTYSVSGIARPDHGSWSLLQNQLILTTQVNHETIQPFEIAPDGKSLKTTVDDGGKRYEMVMVRAN